MHPPIEAHAYRAAQAKAKPAAARENIAQCIAEARPIKDNFLLEKLAYRFMMDLS